MSNRIWIILILVSIFLIVYFFELGPYRKHKKVNLHAPIVKLVQKRENDSTVNAYINFIHEDPMRMSEDHKFSELALIKLSLAINAMSKTVAYNKKNVVVVTKDYANQVTIDSVELAHATYFSSRIKILTAALIAIQQKKYPSLAKDAAALKNSANDIDADVATLDQQKKIKIFFICSARLLKKMN